MKALLELTGRQDGANEELLALGYDVSCRRLAALLRSGLAATQREVVKASGKPIEVRWIRITAAGRKAIEGRRARNNDVCINHRYFPNSPVRKWEVPKQKGDSKAEKVRPGGRMMEISQATITKAACHSPIADRLQLKSSLQASSSSILLDRVGDRRNCNEPAAVPDVSALSREGRSGRDSQRRGHPMGYYRDLSLIP
jgi:hypothetical protein